MKDAKEYNVTFDGVTVKFTATDGTPAKVGIDKAQIPAASKEKIQAVLSDANDVVLSRTDINANNFSKGNVTSAVTLTKGYQDGSSIYLPAVGDTASIKVTYHTGTFGTDGKEAGNIEDTFTVTAVDPSLVNYNFAVTIGAAPAWTAASFQSNDKIKMGEDRNAYFRITKDDGSEIAAEDYADYKVESADKTKLLVTNTPLTNSTTAVPVHGVAEGSTYILVKKDDKVVASLSVTVLGKPVATSLELSRTSVTICTNSAVDEVVNVTIKDQYGDTLPAVGAQPTPTVTLLAKPDKAKTVTAAIGGTVSQAQVATAAGKVTITGNAFAKDNDDLGSYTLKITSEFDGKKLDRTLNVNVVKNAATTQSYEVRIDTPEVDTTVGATDNVVDASKQIKISVAKMANGGAMDTVDEVIYTIKNAKGDVIAHVGDTISGDVAGAVKEEIGTVVSCAAVSTNHNAVDDGGYNSGSLTIRPYNVDAAGIVKNLPAGTYTVEAKVLSDDEKKVVTVNGSFTIKDTQDSRVSFKLLKNDFGDDTVAVAFAKIKDSGNQVVKVYYDGVEQDNSKLAVTDVKGVALANGGAYIKTVKVYVNVSGGTNYVQITLNVNDQIAKCASTGITE